MRHNFSAFSYNFAEKWGRICTLSVRDTQTYGFLACGDVIRIILEEPCRTIMAGMYLRRRRDYRFRLKPIFIRVLMYLRLFAFRFVCKIQLHLLSRGHHGFTRQMCRMPRFRPLFAGETSECVSRSRVRAPPSRTLFFHVLCVFVYPSCFVGFCVLKFFLFIPHCYIVFYSELSP